LKETAKGEDVEAIKAKTNELAQASIKIGEAMYKNAADAGDAGPGAGPGGPSDKSAKAGGDNVVDADFEEVKDDKKKSG
jgi:molecular chaperone DnaK